MNYLRIKPLGAIMASARRNALDLTPRVWPHADRPRGDNHSICSSIADELSPFDLRKMAVRRSIFAMDRCIRSIWSEQ